MFSALANNLEYFKERVNLFVALAPVVKLGSSKQLLLKTSAVVGSSILSSLEDKNGIYELFGKGWNTQYGYVRRLVPIMNKVKIRTDMMNYDLDDKQRTEMLMGHFPHGTSTRSISHLGQMIKTNEFRKFDYGNKDKNIEQYGEEKAPLIPIENISGIPIAMFSGLNDSVVAIENNRELGQILMNNKDSPLIDGEYNELEADHMSFLLGKDMSYFKKVLNLCDTYNK